jgi:hypothetical protein
MKKTISVTLILAIAFGLVLAATGLHSLPVYAQTNATKNKTSSATGTNATKGSGASGNSTAQQQQPSANKGGATNTKSSTSPTTTATVKGGPKAAGTASQLNQIEGNNTQTLAKNANIANKPGIAGLAGESNATGK